MMLESWQVVHSTTGRALTPFPYVDCTTDRRCSNTIKRVDEWLRSNAIAEAISRNDDFAGLQFECATKHLTVADRDGMNLYLFGEI